MLQITWLTLGTVVLVAALRAGSDARALRVGRIAVAVLYLAAGALVNAVMLATGEDYADFADGAVVEFVRDTWRSLVVPNHHVFISILVAFEAAVGILVLMGGRRAEAALLAAAAFHVALLSFGWGFFLWAVPMTFALTRLLLLQHRQDEAAPADAASPARERMPATRP
jgi:hypothetical protein